MLMLKNVTPIQWLGVVILFNSTLLGGASQLADLSLSAPTVKAILAAATLGNFFLGGLVTMFGGQSAMRDTLGSRGDVVITNTAGADALPDNRNVIAATPAMAQAMRTAGAVSPPTGGGL